MSVALPGGRAASALTRVPPRPSPTSASALTRVPPRPSPACRLGPHSHAGSSLTAGLHVRLQTGLEVLGCEPAG